MIPLSLTSDMDRFPWEDVKPLNGELGALTRVGLMRNGTTRGRATVVFLIELQDGTQVAAQTTWALFRSAFTAFNATPIVAEEVIEP